MPRCLFSPSSRDHDVDCGLRAALLTEAPAFADRRVELRPTVKNELVDDALRTAIISQLVEVEPAL